MPAYKVYLIILYVTFDYNLIDWNKYMKKLMELKVSDLYHIQKLIHWLQFSN